MFSLPLIVFTVGIRKLSQLPCRECRKVLDLHQPNPEQPDQFLGTCPGCGSWYRVEARVDEDRATVVKLPEVAEVRGPDGIPPPCP